MEHHRDTGEDRGKTGLFELLDKAGKEKLTKKGESLRKLYYTLMNSDAEVGFSSRRLPWEEEEENAIAYAPRSESLEEKKKPSEAIREEFKIGVKEAKHRDRVLQLLGKYPKVS